MVESILLLFLIILTVTGVCEFVYIGRMLFYLPNTHVKNYSLIVLKSGCAVKQLNYIWQKIRWHGDEFAAGIIALTDSLDQNEIFDCVDFVGHKNIILCTAQSISDCVQSQRSLINGNR